MHPQIPDPTLPRYRPITPRPFDIIIEPREFSGNGGSEPAGAFWTQYTDGLGDLYLQGGTVTGGNGGSYTFPDFRLIDADGGPGGIPYVAGTPGQILYIYVSCIATVADGVMLPGCEVSGESGASDWDVAEAVPPNDSFTVTDSAGNLYREIGRWTDAAFLPSGPPGNLRADGCIGNFQITVA